MLAYARCLLLQDKEEEAAPFLEKLEKQCVPEAPFYRGVAAIRKGNQKEALKWMQRSYQLDPSREETKQQIELLKNWKN